MSQDISSFKVEGTISAPATALKENGAIDTAKIADYVEFLTRHQIDGVFVLGTLGEGMSLSVDERKQVAEAWVKHSQGRLKYVIVHVGTGNLTESIELAKHAEQIKASAVACVCPSYYKPANEEAIVDYMEQVAAAAPNTPFYYYCINFVTGIYLNPARVMELASNRIPNLRGLKMSSREILRLLDCKQLCGGRFNVMIGTDEQFLAALSLGIQVPIVSGYVGPIFKRLKAAYDSGDMERATQEQILAYKLKCISDKYGGGPAAVKAITKCLGLDLGPVRLPLKDMPKDKVSLLRQELVSIGLLKSEDINGGSNNH